MYNFPTLKSYLEWRATMRAEYKTLSKTIRKTKITIAETSRRRALENAGEYPGGYQQQLPSLQFRATEILEQRKEAKVVARNSWETWIDRRQVVAA